MPYLYMLLNLLNFQIFINIKLKIFKQITNYNHTFIITYWTSITRYYTDKYIQRINNMENHY